MPDHPIQNQVDFILFEEGVFSPLSWMLREGHLDYDEYLNWKNGSIKYLEDYFKKPISTLITALQQIQDYATLQKLESFRQTYSSTINQPLHFCRSSTDENIFTTVFEPAHDRMQMDLFFDSAEACAVSDLIKAIVDRRSADVSEQLEKLETLNSDKYLQFTQLLAFEQKIAQSKITSAKKVELLLQKITPLSFEILSRSAHDFLVPLWNKLSEQIAEQPFNPKNPKNHLSFTAFKGFQWQQVLLSVEQEKHWHQYPLLLFRHAESCFKLNKEWAGIDDWFRLFIQFPNDAERLIKESGNRLMFLDWQSFSELDPELETTLFPAWMLINKPVLVKSNSISDIEGNESLLLIEKLVCNAEKEINETAIQLRTKLQQTYPALFVHYMGVNSEDQ